MKGSFLIVGPTATGKSDLAADVAASLHAEIISIDAFQICRGLDLLTGKPNTATLKKAPHHLIGAVALDEEMNVAKFRHLGLRAIDEVRGRGKLPLLVGGSGLYVKALTHGLSSLPRADVRLRLEFEKLTLEELSSRLSGLDPTAADTIDLKNRRRVVRALEICLLTGKPASTQRTQWKAVEAAVPGGKIKPAAGTAAATEAAAATGVFVFRNRDELYARINRRVESMFENGVIEEVRALGVLSATAARTIGLSEIRELLGGKMSIPQCIAQIQQATRRYAKRQLTWFRRQTSLEPLNLSLISHEEAVEGIRERARRSLRVEG